MRNGDRQQINIIDESTILNEPELKRLKVFYFLSAFLLITDIVMPQYFGFQIGFDFTCTRIADIAILFYMVMNPKVFKHFMYNSMRCKFTIPLIAYLFVGFYTMVFRVDVNAFFLIFLEILTLWILVYVIRFVIGYQCAFEWIIRAAYFFGVLGLVDYARGRSTMLQLFKTLQTGAINFYRSGQYRIMGPCGHALAYGLLLLLFIAMACVDMQNNEVYFFKRPLLMALLFVNVLLTGSRSTSGLFFLEAILIIVFGNRRNIKKTLFFLLISIGALIIFLVVFHGTSIANYIMMQLASVVDQFMGTDYAAMYGAETTRLQNSEDYRKMLPEILKLDWLSPILGRGVKTGFSAEINGVIIQSVDNYYIEQYIKYAYPGMISYIAFIIGTLVWMIVQIKKYKTALLKMIFVGTICYFINLWWLDALQTLKYVYIIIALFVAYIFAQQDEKRRRWIDGV